MTDTPSKAAPTAADTSNSLDANERTTVLRAAALGWALTELLGRAYTMATPPPAITWSGAVPRALPLANERSLQERRVALVTYMEALVGAIGVNSLAVPSGKGLPDEGKTYIQTVHEDINTLGERNPLPSAVEIEACRLSLNRRLYWWDEALQDRLPSISARAYAAYQGGRGLAELRWVYPSQEDAQQRASLVQTDRVDLIRRLLLSLDPAFNSRHTAPALANGLVAWTAFLAQQGSVADGVLDTQAQVWRDLITGAREPESYLPLGNGQALQSSFVWKVIKANALPLVLISLVVAVILVVLTWIWLHSQGTNAFKDVLAWVTALAAVLGAAGFASSIINKTTNTVIVGAGQLIWQQAQQEAIEKYVILVPAAR